MAGEDVEDDIGGMDAVDDCLGAGRSTAGKPSVRLSITHKFSSDHDAQRDVGEA